MRETIKANETISHLGTFFRGLMDTAKIESDTKQGWFYSLTLTDKVQAAGTVFRGLLLFVRIVTGVFVRDYLLRRFLKARSELVIKSCISRELVLESKI